MSASEESHELVPGQELAGQVAVVTVASRGVGAAIALDLAAAGADVVLGARNEHDLVNVSNEIKDLGR